MDTDDRHEAGLEELFGQLLASKPQRAGRSTATATITSVAFHVVVVAGAVWATLAFGRGVVSDQKEQVTFLEVHEQARQPTPRPEPPIRQPEPRPALQEAPAPPPQPQIETPAPKEDAGGFQTLAEPDEVLDELPESSGVAFDESDFTGEGVEGGRGGGALDVEADATPSIEDEPSVTPYTVAPVLLNRDEIGKAVRDLYPRMLRRIGASGAVLLWILIDEEGRVLKSAINRSSGREAFDQAALGIPELMRFKPALNNDEPVPVWVVIPIEFRPR
jgi:protein TonB